MVFFPTKNKWAKLGDWSQCALLKIISIRPDSFNHLCLSHKFSSPKFIYFRMAQNPPKDNVDELSVRLEKVHLDLMDESDDYV